MKKYNKKQIVTGTLLIITITLYTQSPEYEVKQLYLKHQIEKLNGVISNLQIRCSSGTAFRQESSYVCEDLNKKIAEQKQLKIEWFRNKYAQINQEIKKLQSQCPTNYKKGESIRKSPACQELNLKEITKLHIEKELNALYGK